MHTQPNNRRHSNGSALVTVMIVILGLGGLLSWISVAAVQRAFMANKLADRVRALAYAEAGAHEAYSVLAVDFAQHTNSANFGQKTYDEGRYVVTVVIPTNSARTAIIHSKGYCREAYEYCILDIHDITPPVPAGGAPPPPEGPAFGYGIMTGGGLSWSGVGTLIGGKIHSNKTFELGGNGQINGDVDSSDGIDVSGNANVSGTVTGSPVDLDNDPGTSKESASALVVADLPPVAFPEIDLTPYYNVAKANSQVLTGQTININSDTVIPGGVLWLEGDASVIISKDVTFTGMIVSTGNLKINSQGTMTAANGYPLIAVEDDGGDLDIQAQGEYNGLIYVKSGMKFTGGGDINGQIILKGDLQKGGNSDVTINVISLPPVIPDDDTGDPGNIVVAAWQK